MSSVQATHVDDIVSNEFRLDPVTGRRVIIAPMRDARPNQFQPSAASQDDPTTCPFCDGQMDTPPMVAEYGRTRERPWQVCVVPNLYPVLQGDSGLHEVVIESPSHTTRMSELSLEQIVLMLKAYRDRMHFMQEQGLSYVQVMKNLGAGAGASLQHTHSQLFGLNFVPQQVSDELDHARDHFAERNQCLFCHLIAKESESIDRLILRTDDFAVWCPHASRFGYETWIAPLRHSARFEALDDGDLEKLGQLFRLVLQKMESHPRIDDFNYLIHTLPFDSHQDDHYHWHIEIIPRIAKQAGFEWGTGIHINTVAPERAASELRIEIA